MKQCNQPECTNNVFSNHYCKFHQHLRTDDKAVKLRTAASTTIHSSRSSIKAKFKAPTGELPMFKELWEERPHISELSGDKLWIFDINNYHHLLNKGAYGNFRLFKPNIIMLTRAEHRLIHDHSFEDLIKMDNRWQKVADRYQQLKEMYNHANV